MKTDTFSVHLDVDEWQVARTKQAIASLDAGRGIPYDQVKRWIASWEAVQETVA
jgi:predicted transcriptional regulator